ncbi:head maturation protease, ClpP-related [Jeotgalibacillus salarius]|uniref:ATP-dependent Clp protease proteolytic subunit n=1 Tax=Jeotgalibacillus salarius TaxID=546023 RepID=A0A4Y8LN52_9BACL|nr:head maturation protease, ClpP-related [Jeotgalibacillus salarius]TFE02881.1 Clp protease ClpP [Jeotgalibacillus salarius]
MKFLKLKNEKYTTKLKSIPHNFAVAHDDEKSESTLTIYGVIGDSWWGDSTSASDVDYALREAGNNDLVIHLNSPGGDAFDGVAIYNRLKKHPGKITVHVDGWACSAASIIAMAADELIMGYGAMIMIHEASIIVWGTKRDLRKQADVMEKLESGIIDIYMTKANVDREEMTTMVDEEKWFSAKEALDIGFATAVASEPEKDIENVDDALINSLQNQIAAMQNEITQLKNTQTEDPAPVKRNRVVRVF